MPEKKRVARKALLDRARAEDARAWAEFDLQLASLDEVQRAELEGLSKDDGSWGVPAAYRNVGMTFDKDSGEPAISAKHGTGGNKMRANEKVEKARDLKVKYVGIWDARGSAEVIARKEDLSVETVRRYFRMTRKNTTGQAAP